MSKSNNLKMKIVCHIYTGCSCPTIQLNTVDWASKSLTFAVVVSYLFTCKPPHSSGRCHSLPLSLSLSKIISSHKFPMEGPQCDAQPYATYVHPFDFPFKSMFFTSYSIPILLRRLYNNK